MNSPRRPRKARGDSAVSNSQSRRQHCWSIYGRLCGVVDDYRCTGDDDAMALISAAIHAAT